jgi:cell division protein FtsL
LSVLAVFITLRVKKVENEISECKSKVKAEWSRITDSKLTIFFLNSPQSISIICISK